MCTYIYIHIYRRVEEMQASVCVRVCACVCVRVYVFVCVRVCVYVHV